MRENFFFHQDFRVLARRLEPSLSLAPVVKRIIDRIGNEHCGGFYAEEVLDDGRRTGFRLAMLGGQSGLLAYEFIGSPVRQGRYGVDLACLDKIGVPAIAEAVALKRLVISEADRRS